MRKCIITNNGRLVTDEVLKTYEVDSHVASNQMEDLNKKFGNEFVTPPYDLTRMMQWMNISVWHGRAIHTKKQDVVGRGYSIKSTDDKIDANTYDDNVNYQALDKLFRRCNKREGLTQILKKVYIDYDGCGNGYLELCRDIKNYPKSLYHVSAANIRAHKSGEFYAQHDKISNKVWFKTFGDTRIIDKRNGKEFKGTIDPKNVASELIHMTQYSFLSRYYGVPEWYPAIISMVGDLKAKEYNLDFFVNFGIPAYVVFIQGGDIGEEGEDAITNFFDTQVKGSSHRTMTMALPQGVTVKFEKLNVDIKDSSFKTYREENRDEILTAHNVPPYRVGVITQGSLGGNVAEETDGMYLDSTVNPKQAEFMWVINELIIKEAFKIDGWEIEFTDFGYRDALKKSQIHISYLNNGVLTPNEVRADLSKDPYVGGDYFTRSMGVTEVGVSQEGIDAGRASLDDLEANNDLPPAEDQLGDLPPAGKPKDNADDEINDAGKESVADAD